MTKPISELFDIKGQVAIVTGGSRGLGKEIARGFGEAGAKIVITARREQWLKPTAEELRAAGYDCLELVGDVADPGTAKAITQATLDRFGRIDILVNNAGQTWGQAAHEMPLEKWNMVMQTNATGTFLMSQAVAAYWIANKRGGKIVNISSVAGLQGSDAMNTASYHASKGAIIAMTRQLAAEWGSRGIYVNAVAPGFFPTRMSQAVLDNFGGEDKMAARVPLRRLGGDDDLKGVVLFFASAASDYVTGQTLAVDGGRAG
jgi:NAD(P)-dependent dehydrogenase (short-subunit alcohol dehydrogenase family)